MLAAKFAWKPLIQMLVTGHWKRFRMHPGPPALPRNLKQAGLYLHVPFCKNLCPFCPYNRIEYDEKLHNLGRNHDGETALNSLRRAIKTGFDSVNADLMFALPGQSLKNWENDLKALINEGVDQISTYPLFSFPYSDLGQSQKIRQVKRPESQLMRSMLDITDYLLTRSGYTRCAVWSWLRPAKKKFSSITRHHYIGFGPSAASMTGKDFYVNTFDVAAYAERLPNKRPIALSMPLDQGLEMAYWLYWRAYELKIYQKDFQDLFGDENTIESFFYKVIKPFELAGMIRKNHKGYHVTDSGSYWIHRLQNEYSLNYINRLWGSCRRETWPSEVFL